jgi:ABC-2 type transport system ATP-binding protein
MTRRLVFLDEPTTGLDPQSRRNFWRLVEKIRAEGKTVLMTTHYMEEASVLCDEIAVVDRGRIIEQGAPRGCWPGTSPAPWCAFRCRPCPTRSGCPRASSARASSR